MTQWVKPLPGLSASWRGAGSSPGCSLLTQLSAHGLGKPWKRAKLLGLLHGRPRRRRKNYENQTRINKNFSTLQDIKQTLNLFFVHIVDKPTKMKF